MIGLKKEKKILLNQMIIYFNFYKVDFSINIIIKNNNQMMKLMKLKKNLKLNMKKF